MKVSKRIWIRSMLCAAAVAAVSGTALAQGQPVKIGLLATLEGPFAAGGADGMRGAELAIRERGGVVAGRKIELIKAWVPLGGKDYASVIARIPKDVDALVVILGGADAVNFLNQYEAAGGDKPMIGGSITVAQDVLNYRGKRRESLVGTLSAGPIADSIDTPEYKAFVASYKKNFPDGYPSPGLFALMYYINMKAALDGLDAVKGDLSGGQAKYREALAKMTLKTPVGDVTLDGNRQGIGTTFITEVVKDAQGNLSNKVVRRIDNVNQMLGQKAADFKIGSRDVPDCP